MLTPSGGEPPSGDIPPSGAYQNKKATTTKTKINECGHWGNIMKDLPQDLSSPSVAPVPKSRVLRPRFELPLPRPPMLWGSSMIGHWKALTGTPNPLPVPRGLRAPPRSLMRPTPGLMTSSFPVGARGIGKPRGGAYNSVLAHAGKKTPQLCPEASLKSSTGGNSSSSIDSALQLLALAGWQTTCG